LSIFRSIPRYRPHRDLASALAGSFLPTLYGLLAIILAIYTQPWITGNEENYFGWAHKFVSPGDFAPNSAFMTPPQYLFLFNWIAGHIIKWTGFYTAWIVMRLGMAIFYALSCAALFCALGLSPPNAWIVVLVTYALTRAVPGGEWIFQGVEAKTFAYACVFLGFYAAIRKRNLVIPFCLIAATYFHFQVGIFWTLPVCVLHYLLHRDRKRTFAILGLCLLGVIPMVALLARYRLGMLATQLPHSGPDANYIYSIHELPFHMAPFADVELWRPRIIAMTVLLAMAIAVSASRPSRLSRALSVVLAGFLVYLFLALGISWLDRNTGWWGKFYLFRPMALAAFLAVTALALPGGAIAIPAAFWNRALQWIVGITLIWWIPLRPLPLAVLLTAAMYVVHSGATSNGIPFWKRILPWVIGVALLGWFLEYQIRAGLKNAGAG
jgi:hypothetical protein